MLYQVALCRAAAAAPSRAVIDSFPILTSINWTLIFKLFDDFSKDPKTTNVIESI